MNKHPRTMPILLFFFLMTGAAFTTEEIRINLATSPCLTYNATNLELYNGTLRLSPTGFLWTNTPDKLKNDSLVNSIFQDSAGNIICSATHFGGPFYNGYRSSDYGNTWTNIPGITFIGLIEASDHNLYGTYSYPAIVAKSADDGRSWNSLKTNGHYAGGICEDSSHNIYVSFSQDSSIPPTWVTNRLMKSSNYGATWTTVYKEGLTNMVQGLRFPWMHALNNDDLLGFREGVMSIPTGLCISTNHGAEWRLISSLSNLTLYGIFQAEDSSFYLYGESGIIRSQDECRTFTTVTTQRCSYLMEAENNVFYRTTSTLAPVQKISRSFDQCSTWQTLPDLLIGANNYNTYLGKSMIQAADRKLYIGGALGDFNNGYIFRSGYLSSNSCVISPAAPASVRQWRSFAKSELLNGGTTQYEFASSSDGGATWSGWIPLSDANLQTVKCHGCGKDLLKVKATLFSPKHDTTPEISWISIQYESDVKDSLENAVIAPNPVKPDSPDGSVTFYNLTPDAEIRVYTVTGRLVVKIKSTEINRLVWDTRDSQGKPLPAGMYTCHITDTQGHTKSLPIMIKR